jgi:hypothetical protein
MDIAQAGYKIDHAAVIYALQQVLLPRHQGRLSKAAGRFLQQPCHQDSLYWSACALPSFLLLNHKWNDLIAYKLCLYFAAKEVADQTGAGNPK